MFYKKKGNRGPAENRKVISLQLFGFRTDNGTALIIYLVTALNKGTGFACWTGLRIASYRGTLLKSANHHMPSRTGIFYKSKTRFFKRVDITHKPVAGWVGINRISFDIACSIFSRIFFGTFDKPTNKTLPPVISFNEKTGNGPNLFQAFITSQTPVWCSWSHRAPGYGFLIQKGNQANWRIMENPISNKLLSVFRSVIFPFFFGHSPGHTPAITRCASWLEQGFKIFPVVFVNRSDADIFHLESW